MTDQDRRIIAALKAFAAPFLPMGPSGPWPDALLGMRLIFSWGPNGEVIRHDH